MYPHDLFALPGEWLLHLVWNYFFFYLLGHLHIWHPLPPGLAHSWANSLVASLCAVEKWHFCFRSSTQPFTAASAAFLILTRFGGRHLRTSSLFVMSYSRVVIRLQATEDMGAATTDDAVGFLWPGRCRRICFWMFGLAMLSSENRTTRMASGTVACGALVRNRAEFSTISRCRVVFLDMLGGRGNSVVEVFNQYYQCNWWGTRAVRILCGERVSSYVRYYMIYTRKARSDLNDLLGQNNRQLKLHTLINFVGTLQYSSIHHYCI